MKKILVFFVASILSFGILSAKDYNVDPSHSAIEFKIKHMTVSTTSGNFGKFSGVISVENNKLIALNGEVDVNSINTNSEGRDAHIKDPEYFDVAKFPKATLKLVKLDGEKGTFDLTIKGITKQVVFDVELGGVAKNNQGKEIVGLEISGKINRKDFDIAKSTPNAALGEEVRIAIAIEGIAK
ncbi:hypothetical protein CCY99_03405 [Helicobacter sp. 16-1353]|uniref:YceI family protein n=1 Tax=Helicobacter sp. 16-1353 TaxID=2004996 RepID=UPI000DCC84AB|nr:YceI family protein [Helicobacter sp. 16-1353]RAX54413.1 hypothetical protein CCY99_03405 [Helicobacter sp. 16-1353]